jgi:hypothetical protein
VVFGITGDLAKVMTFHSLYRLEQLGSLKYPIVGVAVNDWSLEQLREHARQCIIATGEPLDGAVFDRFAARLDADGDLWVAIWGGGRVHRYSPEGVLVEALLLPTLQVTSCAFAGPELNRLYITTATENWSEEMRQAEPAAGLVYRFDTDARGCLSARTQPGGPER